MSWLTKSVGHAKNIEWILSKVIPAFIFIFGGSIQIALARVTPWIESAGPIIYSGLFFAGAFLSLFAYNLILNLDKKRIGITIAKNAASKRNVNPLEQKFERQTISTEDFFNPFYRSHKDKIFQDCNIVGNGNIFLAGCTIKGSTFVRGQIIIVRSDVPVTNVTPFENCTFLGGAFIECSMFMHPEMYEKLPSVMKESIPVISTIVNHVGASGQKIS